MSLNRRGLATLASAAALTLSACGQTDNNESPDIGSGPIPAPKDMGIDISDMAIDFGSDIGKTMDIGMDTEFDTDIDADISDASDSGTLVLRNDLKLDCKFDPLNTKSAYQECLDAADLLLASLDDTKESYISEYGIGASNVSTELIQEQSNSQPQLNVSGPILDPNLSESQTSTIVEGKIFCQIPNEAQVKLDKLTADPNLPFNNCDSTEPSCDLSFTLQDLDSSLTSKLVTRFRFNCPDLGFNPKIDGQSSNIDLGTPSTTIFVEVPFSSSHIVEPNNCELDSSIGIIATECRAFAESLKTDKFDSYFGEVFNTTLQVNLISN